MDCLPQDDVCHLQRAHDSYIQEIVEYDQAKRSAIPLGNFNGKAYTFCQVGGKSVIVVAPAKPDKIGKFELPIRSDQDQLLEEAEGKDETNEGDNRG